MSAYQARPNTDPLERERREIERRRVRLEDRRQRILHAKTRLIGVDTPALAQQVQERRQRAEEEEKRDLLFDAAAVAQSTALTRLLGRQSEARLLSSADLAFTHHHQAAEKRLRDLRDTARRHSPEEPSAVFLQFQGEDPLAPERARQQRSQQRQWATAQVRELERREAAERRDEADYAQAQADIRRLQAAHDLRAAEQRAAANASTAASNAQLAQEKRETQRVRRSLEAVEEAKELSHTFYDPFMTETVRASDTSYQYKGMTQHERQRVLDGVQRQVEERAAQRERESAEAKAYDAQQADYRRQVVLADIEARERAQGRREAVKEERLRQSREKRIQDRYLNEVVYTNPVDEAFFQQFGTSCR